MFEVYFFNFQKRSNSTAAPTTSTAESTFLCTIKSASSLVRPTIELSGFTKTPNFNYCYIPEFNYRYYFIDDIVYNSGVWLFSLRCDVLASYRWAIRNSSQYVLRSTKNIDPNIVDSFYKDKSLLGLSIAKSEYEGIIESGVTYADGVRFTNSDGTYGTVSTYFNSPLSSGSYVVGVVGNNSTGVTFYSMDYSSFRRFVNKAMTLVPSDMSDVSSGIANAIYNPMQYVVSCKWYPDAPAYSGSAQTSLKIGPYTITDSSASFHLVDQGVTTTYRMNIDAPVHPELTANTTYLSMAPYTEYSLYFEPFGLIPLDSLKMYGFDGVTCDWTVDYTTGIAILKVYPKGNRTGLLYYNTCEYGVTIPISSLVMDWKSGAIMSGVTWLKTKAGEVVKTIDKAANSIDSAAGISDLIGRSPGSLNLVDTAMNAYASSMGQVQTVGALGSFLGYIANKPAIYAFFTKQVEHNYDRFGGPTYKYLLLSTLDKGYVLCANAAIDTWQPNTDRQPPMFDEIDSVINLLNSGVYIE